MLSLLYVKHYSILNLIREERTKAYLLDIASSGILSFAYISCISLLLLLLIVLPMTTWLCNLHMAVSQNRCLYAGFCRCLWRYHTWNGIDNCGCAFKSIVQSHLSETAAKLLFVDFKWKRMHLISTNHSLYFILYLPVYWLNNNNKKKTFL